VVLATQQAAPVLLCPAPRLHVAQFEASLQREVVAAKADKSGFISEFSEGDYSEVVGGWAAKLERVAEGEQRWGLFTARKPE
jgi:phosphoethanolamine N-methyltransferase